MIDTGFSGSLCLPRSLMWRLGLQKVSKEEISGIGLHKEVVDIAITTIFWFGQETEIEVMGSELLDGKLLNIDYRHKTLTISEE